MSIDVDESALLKTKLDKVTELKHFLAEKQQQLAALEADVSSLQKKISSSTKGRGASRGVKKPRGFLGLLSSDKSQTSSSALKHTLQTPVVEGELEMEFEKRRLAVKKAAAQSEESS